ncbi:MAG: J domain-containing protein [Ferruginibacter sp.]|nr:J domain-containing protein [Chitinophagaceae bacterium]
MYLKDYYHILELDPSATQQEIKKAYRRLAQQYHPDKNQNDTGAAALFTQIKEAYEVLTNPAKKEYYLQQRWYSQSRGKRKTQGVITPVTVLKQVLEMDKYVSFSDIHRMDKEGLYNYICTIISDDTIEKLNTSNDNGANREIINAILNCVPLLTLPLGTALQDRLLRIHGDEKSREKISSTIALLRKQQTRDQYRVWMVLLIAVLLSFLIFFLSR